MKNAFIILGANPQDNVEKLRELYEEKQLFADDDTLLNTAYTELTNVKKRIIHEIKYFSKDAFEDFDKIFLDNYDEEQEKVLENIFSSIIKVGKWFDLETSELYNTINENRKKSGFTPIGDAEIVNTAVNTLKDETISAVKKCFDYWEQKDIVTFFNMLVEQNDYMSFFIDDLLAHYENLIAETIQAKEKNCKEKFGLVKENSEYFIEYGLIEDDFSNNITAFKRALNAWDKLVQPLQVNYQNRGAQHPGSLEFVRGLRNSVIDMCNKSQKDLTDLIRKIQYDYSAKQTFMTKISNSAEYINLLMKILDILSQVFKEIDIIAERLKNDKQDFENIKESIERMDSQVAQYRSRSTATFYSGYSKRSSYGRSSSSESSGKAVAWIVGIIIIVVILIACLISSSRTFSGGSLTTSNFSKAFSLSHSVSSSGIISYTISEREDYSNNSSSSNEIYVTLKYTFTGGTSGGESGTKEVTLKKSDGYYASGTIVVYGYFSYEYCSVTVSSVTGYVYK